MIAKIIFCLLAVAMLLLLIGPVLIKLKEASLIVVAMTGVVLMLVDMWHTLRGGRD
jgi:hypothetical protein